MSKQTLTFSEGSKETKRRYKDKGESKEKRSGGSINNRTQRGADENQTKRVTCAPWPETARPHTCFGPMRVHPQGNKATNAELEVTKAPSDAH